MTLLDASYGTADLLAVDPGWTASQRQDIDCRDRAERMAKACSTYARHRQAALVASKAGDESSAARSRALATATLLEHPWLLAMVEGGER